MDLIRTFKKNQLGRDFVVGDLHGCYVLLEDCLGNLNFNPDHDRLFSVGDLIDRGSESEKCLQYLDKNWFHAVSGNHEQLVIDYCLDGLDEDSYRSNGGQWLIDKNDPLERGRYLAAFAALPIAMEIQTDSGLIGVVHAECPLLNWDDFKRGLNHPATSHHLVQQSIWARKVVYNPHASSVEGVHLVLCGHTIVQDPVLRGNHFFVDTGAFRTNRLTIIQIQG